MEGGNNNNIRVVVRVKPAANTACPWSCTDHTITHLLQNTIPTTTFHFDRVYDHSVSETRIIFEQVAQDLIQKAVLEGISGTVFAYGQTSAGKTFTMQGPSSNPGIIPLGLDHFFGLVQKERQSGRTVTVRMSYLEVYNEIVGDLLSKDNQNLKIHETVEKGVFVGGLSEPQVDDLTEAMDLVKRGEEVRKIGKTNMNDYSSRSHTLLRLHIESRQSNPIPGMVSGTKSALLCFVDLAGSERSGQMGNEGQRLKEGGHINKSLLSLTSVISKLAELGADTNTNHIPYRDSKLTRILQPALSGNARCIIICAVSPLPQFLDETLSTLKFASRAKAIKSRPILTASEVVTDEDIIRCYREQVECLRGELGLQKKRAATFEDGLQAVKRARRDERQFLKDYLCSLTASVKEYKRTVEETVFIFEHISNDSAAMILECRSSVNKTAQENHDNLQFLEREKRGVELSLNSEITKLQDQLKSSERSFDEQIEECKSAKCSTCLQYRQEIIDLNQCVLRLEKQVANLPCEPTISSAQYDLLAEQLSTTKKQLQEKENDLEMRQSDLNDLLDKLMQSKSEYSSMREQLTARIEELNEEAEHWRCLGKEADDKMDGLKTSLEEKELKVAELETLINLKQETIDSLELNIASINGEKETLLEQIKSMTEMSEKYQTDLIASHTQLEDLYGRFVKMQEQEKELTGKLQESSIREQVLIESHQREVAVILEKLESVERQRADLHQMYTTLQSSSEQRQLELQNLVDDLQKKCADLENTVSLLNSKSRENQDKIEEQLMINSVIKSQLEGEYQQKLISLQNTIEKREEELAQTRRAADDSSSMVELLRSSLKSRQDQHEQSIEELSRVRSELMRLRETAPTVSTADYEQLDRELSSAKDRIRDLEAQLLKQSSTESTGKQEMRLKVELERVKETAFKDRKMSQLRIADLEEQISELMASKSQLQHTAEAKVKEAEQERDTETAKVRHLQEAIKQLTADRKRHDQFVDVPVNPSAAVKENKENKNGKQNECLQQ